MQVDSTPLPQEQGTLINVTALNKKLQAILKKSGIKLIFYLIMLHSDIASFSDDVPKLIEAALKEKLITVIEQLAISARHRCFFE